MTNNPYADYRVGVAHYSFFPRKGQKRDSIFIDSQALNSSVCNVYKYVNNLIHEFNEAFGLKVK